MKFGFHIALASSLLLATPALAQAESEAPAAAAAPALPKSGEKIFSSDGKLVGRVDRVNKDQAGAPTTVSIIFQSKFVYVPVSSLTSSEKGYTSTLSRAEIARGK